MKTLNLVKNDILSVDATIDAGIVSIGATVSESIGGGAAAGVCSFVSDNKIKLSVVQAADLGLLALEDHLPALAPAIAAFKNLVDAELAKV